MNNRDIWRLCFMLFLLAGSFWFGHWIASDGHSKKNQTTENVNQINQDPAFSKLDMSITIDYLTGENVVKIKNFLLGMKEESPLMKYKIEKGPVKYYSSNQLNAIRKAK